MLDKKIVDKAGLAAWYQQCKTKHDSGKTPQLEAFKKRVLV